MLNKSCFPTMQDCAVNDDDIKQEIAIVYVVIAKKHPTSLGLLAWLLSSIWLLNVCAHELPCSITKPSKTKCH